MSGPVIPWGVYNRDLNEALDLLDDPANVHKADQAWPIIRDQLRHHGIDIEDSQTQYVFYSAMKFVQGYGSILLRRLGADHPVVETWNGLSKGMQLEFMTRMIASWDPAQREAATIPWPHPSGNTMHQNIVPVAEEDDDEDDGSGVVEG